MTKKLSETMLKKLNANSSFDDVLEVQNQMLLEDGEPIRQAGTGLSDTASYITKIKQATKNSKIIKLSSDRNLAELKEM